ncbi:hypothetical protein [Nocardioides houyundeii]|uniref:hypothetical protein n=1 Tax=Nocardioides houyundeii TaxID=2045452 RepID=UPI000DF3F744|nr:hypothetical protein [Nocardioides houyundeii]
MRLPHALAVVLLVGMGMGLAGCGNDDKPVQGTPGQIGSTSEDGLSEDFPRDDVPMPDGEVSDALGSKHGFMFVLTVDQPLEATMGEIESLMSEAGFVVASEESSAGTAEAVYVSEEWQVTAAALTSESEKGRELGLPAEVTRLNYAVTPGT